MKLCSQCKRWQPLDAFGPDKRSSDGLRYCCHACRRIAEAAYRARYAEQAVPSAKRCATCSEMLPSDAFTRDRRRASGLSDQCRACRSTARHADRAREVVYERRWRERHRAEFRAQQRRRYWARRDQEVIAMRERYQLTKEARRPKRRAQYLANREAAIAAARRWALDNPAARRLTALHGQQRRRARQHGAAATLTRAEWRAIQQAYHYRCAYCGQKPRKLTMDHVIPLAHGGHHAADNIVPACESCNFRKHIRPAPPFQPVLLLE